MDSSSNTAAAVTAIATIAAIATIETLSSYTLCSLLILGVQGSGFSVWGEECQADGFG